jgi:ATP synthase protein I
MSEHPPDDRFVREARRQAERAARRQHMTFWRGISLIGAVGWMVVIPAVGGAFIGRYLDAAFTSGIFWTLPLLLVGLLVGCTSAWRYVRRELRE